jgi:hypothetical protein
MPEIKEPVSKKLDKIGELAKKLLDAGVEITWNYEDFLPANLDKTIAELQKACEEHGIE